MLTISISKHETTIFGRLPAKQKKDCEKAFSVVVPNFWFAKNAMKAKANKLRLLGQTSKASWLSDYADRWDGTKCFVKFSTTYFKIPTGLLWMLYEFFYNQQIPYTVTDDRNFVPYSPYDVSLAEITLRPFQQQAIGIMAERGNGVLLVGTGGGKTEIAAGLIKKFNVPKTIFLTHRNILETQTTARLAKRLGIPIGAVAGTKFNEEQVTVAMVPTLFNRIDKKDQKYLQLLQNAELVIGDEIHLGTSDSWLKVFKTVNTPHVYGLSGTPWKGNDVDDLTLMSVIGPEIFRVNTRWLIDNGYLTPPIIKFVPIKHVSVSSEPYDEMYSRCIVSNVSRHEVIRKIVEKDLQDKQTLVLVNHIEHGENLCEYLKDYDPILIHSKLNRKFIDKSVDRFSKKEVNLLISTPLLDIGVDIPVLDKLILAGSGYAKTTVLQRIGRSVRKLEGKISSEVYDIMDIEENYLSRHVEERVAIYTDENQNFPMELCDISV